MTLLLTREHREYLVSPGQRLETDLGIVDVPETAESGDTIESHLGEPFHVVDPRPTDLFDHLDRAGAPMLPRDIGLIVGMAGLDGSDHVLDIGSGTGILAITLGRLGIDVTTVEYRSDIATTAKANVATAGVDDCVSVIVADGTELVVKTRFDALTLDTGDAPAIIERAPELLAPGGVVAAYAPFVETARQNEESAREVGLTAVETVETIQRRMEFDDRGSRPTTGPVGHSGYFTFARTPPNWPK